MAGRYFFLICPDTSEGRLDNADRLSTGFVYAVSQSATTGSKLTADTTLKRICSNYKTEPGKTKYYWVLAFKSIMILKQLAYLDGAIVGSAFFAAYQTTWNR